MYDTLVLSGNSTNAISTLGSLQCLLFEGTISLDALTTYVGTSSGSILSTLMAIGYEPIDILTYLCINKSFSKMSGINLSSLGAGGLMCFDPIQSELENIITARIGFVPTLYQLYEMYGKIVYYVTFNMTDGVKEYVSYLTHPDLSVTVAARMSCTFPFIFKPFHHNGKYYVDGGVVDNFAMKMAQSLGGRCIGVCNINTFKEYTPETSNFDLLFRLFSVFVCSFAEGATATANNRIVKLVYEPSFFNFASSNAQLVDLFDVGYDKAKQAIQEDVDKIQDSIRDS